MKMRRRKRLIGHMPKRWVLRPPKWPFFATALMSAGDLMRLKQDPWKVFQR